MVKKFLLATFFAASIGELKAADVYKVIIEKQKEKEAKRWTLADWLATKEKMKMQDMWLAANSSPFELMLATYYNLPKVEGISLGDEASWSAAVAAYAGITGLQFEYDATFKERMFLFFALRVFGFFEQGSNITLEGGLRQHIDSLMYRQAFVGAHMRYYITRFLGVEGLYRYYFQSMDNKSERFYDGYMLSGGFFIDYSLLQIVFNGELDKINRLKPTRFNLENQLYKVGLRFYF